MPVPLYEPPEHTIKAAVPAGNVIHLTLDNYGSHKHPKMLRWLARHPRLVFHLTLTSGSWLNTVDTFPALPRRRLRQGTFRSVMRNEHCTRHSPTLRLWSELAPDVRQVKAKHLGSGATRECIQLALHGAQEA